MANAISPIRFGNAVLQTFQATELSLEVDFELGIEQGIALFNMRFQIAEAVHVPAAAYEDRYAYLTVHVETGNLEDGPEIFTASRQSLNSEIIASSVLSQLSQEEAATRGGSSFSQNWLGKNWFNYREMYGEPLLLAQNFTFRGIASDSDFTINGAQAIFEYQYVKLTQAELAAQFLLRR